MQLQGMDMSTNMLVGELPETWSNLTNVRHVIKWASLQEILTVFWSSPPFCAS